MKVATYNHHHLLPFWHTPANPDYLFKKSDLEGWTYRGRIGVGSDDAAVRLPAVEHWIMPVLDGLVLLDLPLMAHVSFVFDKEKNEIEPTKRVWVQISTEPIEWSEAGLPIIVKEGKVQVNLLWCSNGSGYDPFSLLPDKYDEEAAKTPEFWREFFLTKLVKNKAEAIKKANEAMVEAERLVRTYAVIPSLTK